MGGGNSRTSSIRGKNDSDNEDQSAVDSDELNDVVYDYE